MSQRTLAVIIVIASVVAMIALGQCAEWFVPTDPPVSIEDYQPENPDCVTLP